MGMESDNHVNMTFEEQQELAAKEKAKAEAAAKEKENDPCYTAICPFTNREDKRKLLLIDKNRKYYTLDLLGYKQDDPKNNTPFNPVWSKNPIPISESDAIDFFG